jgi:hypothetical protein
MPLVQLSPAIRRQVQVDALQVDGATAQEALLAFFCMAPKARAWVVDDRGRPWPHVAIFIDGRPVVDRALLNDPVQPDSSIEIWPALSGG